MKYLPSILAAIGAGLTAIAGPIQSEISKHPTIGALFAAVSVIVAHFLPSPGSAATK
ncbi:MAG TPA: hypothetical protein VGY31_03465 [Terriglobia bacterium]|nr:hypothetical protein [Terriglobia bacterium]